MERDLESILTMTTQERNTFEHEQNIYSLVKTIEYLEWAFMSGKIKGPEYDKEFRKLHTQYDGTKNAIHNFNIGNFMAKYQLEHCSSAKQRIQAGKSSWKGDEIPANVIKRVADIS